MNRKKFQPYLELVQELTEYSESPDYEARKQEVLEKFEPVWPHLRYGKAIKAQIEKLFAANNVDRALKLLKVVPTGAPVHYYVIVLACLAAAVAGLVAGQAIVAPLFLAAALFMVVLILRAHFGGPTLNDPQARFRAGRKDYR